MTITTSLLVIPWDDIMLTMTPARYADSTDHVINNIMLTII